MSKLLFSFLLFFAATVVFGQNDTVYDATELLKEQGLNRQITAEYQLETDIDTLPQRVYKKIDAVKNVETETEEQQYEAGNYSLNLAKLDPKLRVYPIKDKAEQIPYSNLVRVGFGNYTSPFLEVFANTRQTTPFSFGGRLKHFSSSTGPVDKKNSAQSFNEVDLFGKYFNRAMVFSGNANYTRLGNNYYGYNDTITEVNRDTLDINYHVMNANVGFAFNDSTKKFKLNSEIGYYYLLNNIDAREGDLVFTLDPYYSINKDKRLYIHTKGSILSYSDSSSNTRSFVEIKPAFSSKSEVLNYEVGFNATINTDSSFDKNVFIYPYLSANMLLERPHGVRAYAGITGQTLRNSLRSTIFQNPYLEQNFNVQNTNNAFTFYGGIRGTLVEKITINVKGEYGVYNNLLMFNNDSLVQEEFEAVYDDGSLFKIGSEVIYHATPSLNISFDASYTSYNLDNYAEALHLPGVDMMLSGAYKIRDRIKIVADFYYIDLLYAYNHETSGAEKIASIVDLNLRGTYYFNNKMAAFVHLNNLLNRPNAYYNNYRTKGISFVAGLSYSF